MKSHVRLASQAPEALQASTCRPLPHLISPGRHDPRQTPSSQRFSQAADDRQMPPSSQVWGVSPPVPLQRLLPGRHSPVHAPSPEQTKAQICPGSQVPAGLQVSGVRPLQRLAPGRQLPPHEPLEHTLVQGVPATHWPPSSQVSGVSPPAPAHRRLPGRHSPAQAPWPWHTN